MVVFCKKMTTFTPDEMKKYFDICDLKPIWKKTKYRL